MAKRLPKSPDQIAAAEAEIRDREGKVDYTIREYPLSVIVSKLTEGEEEGENELFVPDYQRDYVWDVVRGSRFIESLMMDLPTPYLFAADIGSDIETSGRLEIVDGTQRIRTLAKFLNDELTLTGLKLMPALNGFRYSDLPTSRLRRFNRTTIRLVELTQRTSEETRRDMFDRINTGAMVLNEMEKRRGSYPGVFLDMIHELAMEPRFLSLAPVTKSQQDRFERQELVIRFFALNEGYENFGLSGYGKMVNVFVDKFGQEATKTIIAEGPGGPFEASLRSTWYSMLGFVEQKFPYGFAKSATAKVTPRVRFEAISIGVARAQADAAPNPPQGQDAVMTWLEADEFKRLTTSDAANNRARVLNRINFVRGKLGSTQIAEEEDTGSRYGDADI